jgi:ankyrin repeat protein
MLHQLLQALSKKSIGLVQLEELKLTEEQKKLTEQIITDCFERPLLPEIKEHKTFKLEVYQMLYPYLLLAYLFEKNGVVEEHTMKLACLFDTADEALKYLVAFGDRNKSSSQFVHDACLFQLPAPRSRNFKAWRTLAKKNLLDDSFCKLLSISPSIDDLIAKDKEKQDALELDVFNRHMDIKEEKTPITPEQHKTLQNKLKSKISEKNKFCRKFAANHYEMSKDQKNVKQNTLYLVELNELYSDRAILHLRKNTGQYGVNDFQDVYKRMLKLSDPTKEIFIKNGIPEKFYNQFTILDRTKAGKNIPDLLIHGESMGYPRFYLRKLNVQNEQYAALAACLGKKTNCCQSLSGEAGEPCVIHGLTSPNGGFYVLFNGDPEHPSYEDIIYAQSWVWRSKTGAIVFDSIEVPRVLKDFTNITSMVKKIYRELAFQLVHRKNIPLVNCGKYSGISEKVAYDYICKSTEEPIDYNLYRDSHNQLSLAHKDLPYQLDSKIQSHDDMYIEELQSNRPIQSLTKLNFSINIALELNHSDLLDYLIFLAKTYGTEIHTNHIEIQKKYKNLLEKYEEKKDSEVSNTLYSFIEKNFCNINICTKKKENIVELAIKYDDIQLLQYLIKNDSNILIIKKYLDIIIENNQSNILQLILSYPQIIPINNIECYNLIKNAVKLGHVESFKLLLKLNPDLSKIENPPAALLRIAIETRNTEISRKYIWKALKDSSEIISLIMESCNEETKNEEFSSKITSFCHYYPEDFELAKLLLDKGASINTRLKNNVEIKGGTGLHYVVANSEDERLKFLLDYKEQKADLEVLDDEKNTPLFNTNRKQYRGSLKNHINTLELMLKAGVNINATNAKGQTFLMYLIDCYYVYNCYDRDYSSYWRDVHYYQKVQTERVKLVLKYNPTLLTIDHNGDTAIILAAKNNAVDLVPLILESKLQFDINSTNRAGETALSLIAAKGSLDLLELLLKHGADPTKMDINKYKLEPEIAERLCNEIQKRSIIKQVQVLNKPREEIREIPFQHDNLNEENKNHIEKEVIVISAKNSASEIQPKNEKIESQRKLNSRATNLIRYSLFTTIGFVSVAIVGKIIRSNLKNTAK